MTRKTIVAACTVALIAALAATPAAARITVGDITPVAIDGARQYAGRDDGSPRLVWEHEISRPGATYLALHFRDFLLAPGDWLQVSDAIGGQAYRLEGRGKLDAGDFWARHVKGDTIRLQLWATSPAGAQGFTIDELAEGFADLGAAPPPATESICGSDDKENAICFSGTPEYEHARPVARLLIAGASLCTGWLASGSGHLVTNEHCITSNSAALNTDYEFMAEAPTCGSGNCQLCWPGDVYSGGTLIQDNAALDYALVLVANNPAATYGWLAIDNRDAVLGEQIYIPQHPGGRAKEIASEDAGAVCTVDSVTSPGCTSSSYNDVGYLCDTEGGSSGSPVIASSSNKVIALHHCAACPNRGVPIDLVYGEIGGLLGPQCAVDADCDDGNFCNGAETCTDEQCVDQADPCPGANCDEVNDVCVPIVCDNDGVCETDEDCNDCGNDCISGTASSAVCGDNVCEPFAGEDCFSCAADCNGVTSGKPSSRFCCGDSVTCSDSRCTGNGNTCNPFGSGPGEPYCCGDGSCTGDENSANCAVDCGSAPFCGDSVCDGGTGEDPCTCPADCPGTCGGCDPIGATCTSDADCCSNKCRGPSGGKTCK